MKNLLLLLGLVFGSVGLLYVGGVFASSETEVTPPPAAAPVEPVITTIEVPAPGATKFVVGDAVTVDGLTLADGVTVPVGKVAEALEVRLWINMATGESIESRAYRLEFVVEGQTHEIEVPEVAIKKAQ